MKNKENIEAFIFLIFAYLILIIFFYMLYSNITNCHNKGGKYIDNHCIKEEFIIKGEDND